jgi:hypothetical protein
MQENSTWLKISDTEMTSPELVAEVEQRVRQRRQTLGQIDPQFPAFGILPPVPEITLNNPALEQNLRRLNQMDPPPMTPVLAVSPATRIPLLGNLWQLVRRQFHELILFYVNRAVSHETKVDTHIISTLTELTRVIQAQQEEIERLRDEVRTLEEAQK